MKASNEIVQTRVESAAGERRIAELTIEAEGSEFVRKFVKELAIDTDSLPEVGLGGSTLELKTKPPERFWRVKVSHYVGYLNTTYTNFFYAPGDLAIRCHTFEGMAFKLPLSTRAIGGGIGVILEDSNTPATAEQAAQFVVQRMVRLVKPSSQ